jgi:hypothetical protein
MSLALYRPFKLYFEMSHVTCCMCLVRNFNFELLPKFSCSMLCAYWALSQIRTFSENFPETFCVSEEHYDNLMMLLKKTSETFCRLCRINGAI